MDWIYLHTVPSLLLKNHKDAHNHNPQDTPRRSHRHRQWTINCTICLQYAITSGGWDRDITQPLQGTGEEMDSLTIGWVFSLTCSCRADKIWWYDAGVVWWRRCSHCGRCCPYCDRCRLPVILSAAASATVSLRHLKQIKTRYLGYRVLIDRLIIFYNNFHTPQDSMGSITPRWWITYE